MGTRIRAIEAHLPTDFTSNEDIANQHPEWSVEKIAAKTGINKRHIAGKSEFASDLAIAVAQKLFSCTELTAESVDYLILVTQSGDYILPTTACLVQDAVGIPTTAGAIDVNMGCSGYIYGLGLAKGLIETGQAKNVLLITSDTYSKYLNPNDKSVKTIFGDGSTATWLDSSVQDDVGPFVYGTDGSGAKNLILANGNLRNSREISAKSNPEERNLEPSEYDLFMDGPEIFTFTLKVVEGALNDLLGKAKTEREEVDFFILHQANAFMLQTIRDKIGIPTEKFPILMEDWGNTVSSTIPMAIYELWNQGRLPNKSKLALIGFGVGLSWAGSMVQISLN